LETIAKRPSKTLSLLSTVNTQSQSRCQRFSVIPAAYRWRDECRLLLEQVRKVWKSIFDRQFAVACTAGRASV